MEHRQLSPASASTVAVPRSASTPLRVQILMFDGVEEQDFVGPLEALGWAQHLGHPVTVTTVTVDGPGPITCTFGTRVEVTTGWSPQDADILVVPGGGYRDKNGPGIHRLVAAPEVMERLRQAHRSGVVVAGVCIGVMVLSGAGLTKGRPCTTHHVATADLAAQGGELVNARVVDDGDLITSGGVTSGLDLGLWLVERELGAQAAVAVEAVLEYERRGTVWRR